MAWSDTFKDDDKVFAIKFTAIDKNTGRPLPLAKEIGLYQIGDMTESLGERVKYYYGGNRDEMMAEYLTSAYRRAMDWIERGK